jgi:predicted nucleic acid-binding protein
LLNEQHQLCTVPQNFYELWVVATRPTSANGLGFLPARVSQEIARLKQVFIFLDDTPAVYSEWEALVALHSIVGKSAHDTRLVAAVMVHGITHILTFNKQDFQRFTNIMVHTPADVMAASIP